MNGSYTPRTLPVGGEEAREVSPRSLAEALLVKKILLILSKSFVVRCCGLRQITTLAANNGSLIIIQYVIYWCLQGQP